MCIVMMYNLVLVMGFVALLIIRSVLLISKTKIIAIMSFINLGNKLTTTAWPLRCNPGDLAAAWFTH